MIFSTSSILSYLPEVVTDISFPSTFMLPIGSMALFAAISDVTSYNERLRLFNLSGSIFTETSLSLFPDIFICETPFICFSLSDRSVALCESTSFETFSLPDTAITSDAVSIALVFTIIDVTPDGSSLFTSVILRRSSIISMFSSS